MRKLGLPSPTGLDTTGKLFTKIYNAFYCSKKSAAVAVEEGKAERQDKNLQNSHTLNSANPPTSIRDIRREWFAALRSGDVNRVASLLSTEGAGIDVNATDEHGWHPLHIAAWNGYTDLAGVLIEKDSHVNFPGLGNSTPLTLAAQKGHLELVRLLVAANGDVQRSATLGDSMDVTALHLAAQNGHTEIVRYLVANGAVVNAQMSVRGIKGVTALHLAVQSDHLDIMDILIKAGCDVQSTTQPSTETPC